MAEGRAQVQTWPVVGDKGYDIWTEIVDGANCLPACIPNATWTHEERYLPCLASASSRSPSDRSCLVFFWCPVCFSLCDAAHPRGITYLLGRLHHISSYQIVFGVLPDFPRDPPRFYMLVKRIKLVGDRSQPGLDSGPDASSLPELTEWRLDVGRLWVTL